MQSRRDLLITTAGALAWAGTAAAVSKVPSYGPPPEAQLKSVMDDAFAELLDRSPQRVTSLGLDKGDRAAAKSRLGDVSAAAIDKQKAFNTQTLRRLQAIDPTQLSGMAKVNHAALTHSAETNEASGRFGYGDPEGGAPYVISQLTGAYQDIPSFLANQHEIETKADADAYLSRLEAFATVMDQETERARHDIGRGVIPPDFVIERTLTQMGGLQVAPAASTLVRSVADRAKAKGIAGDYEGRAAAIYSGKVMPALARQIDLMKETRSKAVHDAGVWRLPEGEAYYAQSLKVGTTTNMSAAEVHQMGLEQARELSARADVILKGEGYTKGTVGERIRAVFDNPKYRYANTDAAKETLIADLNKQVVELQARLPRYFATLPKAPVRIQRVPKFIEAGAPGGYYNTPSLDGSRPGIYWINLRDTAETPTWTLKTLTVHEAIPGHHLQLALQQEADLPMIRRANFLSAYGEGWALYSEELGKEMGIYEGDPMGELGFLQAALFRSARLVVDTGMHDKRWSREKAIETMSSIDGNLVSSSTTEIERYCVWPGQATSYMVGKLTWLKLRQQARAALGPKFDIRQFHDAGLLPGCMPLAVLEGVIGDYVKTAKA